MTGGANCKSIARTLNISVATARKHRENLMRKLQVTSLAALLIKVMGSSCDDVAYDNGGIVSGAHGDRE